MQDIGVHEKITAPAASGLLSWLFGALFDFPPDLIFVAFVGCFIGFLLRDKIPELESKLSTALHFIKTLAMLLVATILTSWVAFLLVGYWPTVSQKTITGLTGCCLVYFQPVILTAVKAAIERVIGKVGA